MGEFIEGRCRLAFVIDILIFLSVSFPAVYAGPGVHTFHCKSSLINNYC